MRLALVSVVGSLVCSLPCLPALGGEDVGVRVREEAPGGEWALEQSDRVFLVTWQAATQAPMSFRVGTQDQLQTVQGHGSGFLADVYADFAPLSWVTVGATASYGSQDQLGNNEVSPTAYVKAQVLRSEDVGVNLAAAVQYKQVGFSPFEGDGEAEVEGMLLADRRLGRLALSANAVFGASLKGSERDAELKAAAGWYVAPNVIVGVDGLARYDLTPSGEQPAVGRSFELVGGPMATLKLDRLTFGLLAGVSAPMHVAAPGVGAMGMLQVGYGW